MEVLEWVIFALELLIGLVETSVRLCLGPVAPPQNHTSSLFSSRVLLPNKTLHSQLFLSIFFPDVGMNGTYLTGFLERLNEMTDGKHLVQDTGHDMLSIVSNVGDNQSTACRSTGHGAGENVTRTIEFLQFINWFHLYKP